ncbi:MAG: L,D-transpeptidase [Lachnospiraceae bacterium]|nr:L,D-transpeptidase [Lachnospiraceae bacterium]
MKKLSKTLGLLIFLAALVIIRPSDVFGQPVASVTYNFSGYTIPAGRDPIFRLDQNAVTTLLSRNLDGSFAVNSAGNFSADRTAVTNFVNSLAALYDVPGVTALNKQAEVNYLVTAINSGISDPSHAPSVKVSAVLPTPAAPAAAAPTADPSIGGGTYVDVNLTSQQLVYFVNGAPSLISDVVTGNTSKNHGTPVGTFSIYGKATNRTLKGPGYSAFVRYWMPFYGGYGLHDASWRGAFGGNIYKTNGSHGCVNMPRTTAEALFATINVGTPVVVHY